MAPRPYSGGIWTLIFERIRVVFRITPPLRQVHRLGISELLYAIAFGVIFIAGFRHPLG